MEDENRFGGERLDSKSSLAKNNLLEHLIRYKFVIGDPEQVVLDIGCGSGHGSHTLASKFKEVYAVDISEEAISYAKKYWNLPNIKFTIGDSLSIPFPEDKFDVVVAFEVFEHLTDWKKFLLEIKRVLKPTGKLYISTPNKTLYSPGTKKPINPHHIFEMTIPEFESALSEYFNVESIYGQRTPIYNDHWIWGLVNPVLFTFKSIIPYRVNNTLKLKIINWIKPELEESDIVLDDDPNWLKRSRFMVGVCLNNK
jgi:ubiquinone/menaquinone biosynthesis C-methylase UbiE